MEISQEIIFVYILLTDGVPSIFGETILSLASVGSPSAGDVTEHRFVPEDFGGVLC